MQRSLVHGKRRESGVQVTELETLLHPPSGLLLQHSAKIFVGIFVRLALRYKWADTCSLFGTTLRRREEMLTRGETDRQFKRLDLPPEEHDSVQGGPHASLMHVVYQDAQVYPDDLSPCISVLARW